MPPVDIQLTGFSSCDFEDVSAETPNVSYHHEQPLAFFRSDRLRTANSGSSLEWASPHPKFLATFKKLNGLV